MKSGSTQGGIAQRRGLNLVKLKTIKQQILELLKKAGIEDVECRRQADLIAEYATGWSLTEQVINFDQEISAAAASRIMSIIECRQQRMPLQYCLGEADFAGLKLAVGPGVLIPRTDTETIVEVARGRLKHNAAPRIIEIGIGSGAIAISLLKAIPLACVVGIDISACALEFSRKNALRHGVMSRLSLIHADWQTALEGKVDAIISNPPYIPLSESAHLQPEIEAFEPPEALFGQGLDGLDFYRLLSEIAPRHLLPEGLVVVEVGDKQAQEVRGMFAQRQWRDIQIEKDLNSLPRAVSALAPMGFANS